MIDHIGGRALSGVSLSCSRLRIHGIRRRFVAVSRRPSSHSPDTDLVWGIHPCAAILISGSRRVLRVIQDSSGSPRNSAEPILTLAVARRLPIQRIDRSTFQRMFRDEAAQGVGIEVERSDPVPIDDAIALNEACAGAMRSQAPAPLVLALDELTDPHNVGAILRTAMLTDVSAVLICDRNSAPLNGVVSKTSSGALEWLLSQRRVLVTRHLASLLSSLHDPAHFGEGSTFVPWRVIGCSSVAVAPEAGARTATHRPNLISFHSLTRSTPTVFVLGNEGRGLRPSVLQACSHSVSVPMAGTLGNISLDAKHTAVARLAVVDSFNVSVAAAILLAQMMQRPSADPG